jgi:hypothetical protein
MQVKRRAILILLCITLSGCVEQVMTVKTNPPGAVVYLNDQVLGRTPLEKDFTWYGIYDVEVRKDGYEALKTHKWVKAPWWNWVPFDLFAELVPWRVRDQQTITFTLKPITQAVVEPGPLMERATQLRGELQSSEFTRHPTTAPATQPAATKPSPK